MLALYRCGRQADALGVFHDTRGRLVEELGIEPGPDLQELHQRILTRHPVRDRESERIAIAGTDPAVQPRQLPPAVRHFAGQLAELDWLTRMSDQVAGSAGTVVITAIGGTAGVGKTALAVQWAHQASARFPDGQLYVNLRGFDPSQAPVRPYEAIRLFLDALNVPADRTPAGMDAQVGLNRSLVAGLQMLIVLDNARGEEQVRPLLPGSPGCLVVVTSRFKLTGLVTSEGADILPLDVLDEADARELLGRRLGAHRMATTQTGRGCRYGASSFVG